MELLSLVRKYHVLDIQSRLKHEIGDKLLIAIRHSNAYAKQVKLNELLKNKNQAASKRKDSIQQYRLDQI